MDEQKFVLVCTDKRGVFAGYGPSTPDEGGGVTLTDARMCLYWPSECRGVLGLASVGPLKGSRVGPAVPTLALTGVTAIAEVTDDARDLWLTTPWE